MFSFSFDDGLSRHLYKRLKIKIEHHLFKVVSFLSFTHSLMLSTENLTDLIIWSAVYPVIVIFEPKTSRDKSVNSFNSVHISSIHSVDYDVMSLWAIIRHDLARLHPFKHRFTFIHLNSWPLSLNYFLFFWNFGCTIRPIFYCIDS